ncbi:4-demethylwyosine synthase TYW1 [archaeon]|jgi:tRNA wybutosine-synthesizing protein 1|nr:4-demethylwyosine synthase TYW1 [archaeon]MBT4022998.1 4-demethylwyosine synthase TYW1 [archaeon]MBT4271989.1 4-demethylwyosine synthase TYW1 [archaeon]MBT4461827.1 4-demethylwyosine synthase TYW1 [archaeon]MBT4858158.1 4-demethylwyosine synthase TYW1 [archaeon]
MIFSSFEIRMVPEKKRIELERQGYRIVGNHSAVKICGWTKKSMINRGLCYKNTFYGIKTWRCVQMTPALQHCNFRCWHCWRDISTASKEWSGPVDDPKEIVDGCIKEHVKLLIGFKGNSEVNMERLEEMYKPMHFAISLTGEPTMYPRLPELIDEIHSRGITAYLVTNGSCPEMIEKLIGHEPTQFYITLAAPTKELFIKDTNPLIKDAWERFNKTLQIMKNLKTRRVLRLTLTKGYNMVHPELFGEFIKKLEGHYDYVECKGYMHVGYSMRRLSKENMPSHDEIREFAKQVGKYSNLVYVDEKPESSVVLLMKKENLQRIMNYDDWKFEEFKPQMLDLD